MSWQNRCLVTYRFSDFSRTRQACHDGVRLRNCRLCVGADRNFWHHRRRQECHENPTIPKSGLGRLAHDNLIGMQGEPFIFSDEVGALGR